MHILMVLTSHTMLGRSGRQTGFWLEEVAAPYYAFKEAGLKVSIASPKGGVAPMDPQSNLPTAQTEATRNFMADTRALADLSSTIRLEDVFPEEYDAVFYPGGHGPLWDLVENKHSIDLIEKTLAFGNPVAALCHGSGVLRYVRDQSGLPLVKGRAVTGFSNSEENLSGTTSMVPFLVEEMLWDNGGYYSKAENWRSHVVVDGLLVTGQNPQSSSMIAQTLLEQMMAQVED